MKILLAILVLLSSCSENSPVQKKSFNTWPEIKKSGKITVLTLNSSTSFFRGKDGEPEGFEYELVNKFAKVHNLKVEFILKDTVKEIIEDISLGKADFAAAGITITTKRLQKIIFSPTYMKVRQNVICSKRKKIKKTKDLKKLNLIIPKETSYEETLTFLKKIHKDIKWEEVVDKNSEVLLQEVYTNKNLCTLADSHIANLHMRYMPELKKVFSFQNDNNLAWAMNKNNRTLKTEIDKWFNKSDTKRYVKDLKRKYFEFIEFDAYNLKTFKKRIKSRLPKYIHFFKEAEIKYKIPWKLLAAISYQESFWNPKAVSPTGVRGMMMLTRKTAKEVGVKNRVDPKQSIQGGAKYFAKLLKRVPNYIHPEDRLWYALASYNVGFYHVRDATSLSIWKNMNPTRWYSIEQVLPLLSEKKYYRRLPFGHARGLEPVIYVKRIKDFYDILKRTPNIEPKQ